MVKERVRREEECELGKERKEARGSCWMWRKGWTKPLATAGDRGEMRREGRSTEHRGEIKLKQEK